MTNLALQDLRDIYDTTINQFPFDSFINILDSLLVNTKPVLSLDTRNKNDQLRKYKGEYYFSLRCKSGNILFGGNENTPSGKRVPTLKIHITNRILQRLSPEDTFPSQDDRSGNRMCVVISSKLFDVLLDILQEEISNYLNRNERQLSNSQTVKVNHLKMRLFKKRKIIVLYI